MSEYKRPTVASLLSRRLRCWRAASQQLIDPATLADAKLESTLTNENNKKLRYLIADLNSHVRLALPCELTRQKPPCACRFASPRRRTTTRSPTVRLNSKLSKATLTSRTEKIRRQNIMLNSCSFTLKERSDSDDIVRQKSSKKQRKSGDGRDADVVAKTLLEKKSRQKCRTVLKLGRNIFGLSTHHSNVKKED